MYCNWLKRMMVVLFALGLVFGVASDALAECEHSLTKKGEIEYRWQYYDEKNHWELRRIQILCYYCGQFLQYDDIYGYFEDHTPGSNGKCTKCGSSTSTECTHSRTYWSKTANVTRSWRDEGTETQHKVYDEYSRFCENCGYYFESEERNFRWENHYFRDDGSCGGCGYQKSTACTHVNTETTTVKTEYEPISGNDKQHQVIRHTKVVCASCGKDMGAEDVEYSTAAHSFGSNNKCTSCGYQKSTECKHTSTSTTTVKTEYEPITGNEKQHQVIKHNQVSCSSCGKVLKENEVEYWVGSHSFNSNGHCSSCGYKKADCVHANTSKKYITDAEYINVDAEQHYMIRYYNLICSKCKKVVEENVRGEELQKHSLDNLGACRYCDYSDIAKCKHWHTTDTVLVKQNYQKRDQREHKVEGLGTVTCDDCHVVIEENAEVYNYEYHNFDRNAVCLYCGYQIKINEDRSLGVRSTHTFYVSKEGESHTYRMNGIQVFEWTVHSTVDWISLSTSGGKHGDSCTYTVAENTGEDRCGNIIFEDKYAGVVTVFIIQEGSREATVKMHPTLTGFSVTPTTVNLGDSITVSGIVSGNGAKLTAVSVGVRNYSNQDLGGYWGHQTSLYDDTFDLSSFGPIALSGEFGNTDFESGQWIVEVYATTEDGLGFATSHSKIITVHNRQSSTEGATPEVPDEEQPSEEMSDETDEETVTICEHQRQHLLASDITTYNQIVDNSSDHQVETHYSLLCSDCNEIINPDYVEVKNEKHTFVNGVCLCGATQQPVEDIPVEQPNATCNHIYGYNYADVSEGEWQSVNDDYHKRVTVLYKDVCTLCGDVRYERRADEAAVQEEHTWGKTKWLDYEKLNDNEHYRTGMTSCTALGCTATKDVIEKGVHEYNDEKCVCGDSYRQPNNQLVDVIIKQTHEIEIPIDSDILAGERYKLGSIVLRSGECYAGKHYSSYDMLIDTCGSNSAAVQCMIVDTLSGEAFNKFDSGLQHKFEIRVDGKSTGAASERLTKGAHNIELWVDGTQRDVVRIYCLDSHEWDNLYGTVEAEGIQEDGSGWKVKINRVEFATLFDERFDEYTIHVYANDGHYVPRETDQGVMEVPLNEGWDSIDLSHYGFSAWEVDNIAHFGFTPRYFAVYMVAPWGEYHLLYAGQMADTRKPQGLLERVVYGTIDTALGIGEAMYVASDRYQQEGNEIRLWVDSLEISSSIITGMDPIQIVSSEIANTIYQDILGMAEVDQSKVQTLKTLVSDILNMDTAMIKDCLRLDPMKDYSDKTDDYLPSFDEGFTAQLRLTDEIVDLYGLNELLAECGLSESDLVEGAYSLTITLGSNIPKQDGAEAVVGKVLTWQIERWADEK